jgi:hypothetical protein
MAQRPLDELIEKADPISGVPFLWTQGPAISERSRRPVPVAEAVHALASP